MDTETEELDDESSEEEAPKRTAPKRYVAFSQMNHPLFALVFAHYLFKLMLVLLSIGGGKSRRRLKKLMQISN
jgi:hypothetical protein